MTGRAAPPARPLLPRRQALGLLGSLALLAPEMPRPVRAATSAAAPFTAGATLLVAGPQGGMLDHLSQLIAPSLAGALATGHSLTRADIGGLDGVTGANQFAARTPPDGMTALMVPGAAALAWLSGDSRAHFDPARWVPLLAATSPGIVAGRLPRRGLGPGARLRVAAAAPVGPDLAALLALDLLGVAFTPVFGLPDSQAARDALAQGRVDLVFLHGHDVPRQVRALPDAQPIFSLGSLNASGGLTRDPLFPHLPHMAELFRRLHGQSQSGPLFMAWRAAAAAAQLDFALVLPPLTPASLIALWRRAGAAAVSSPNLQATAAANAFRPLAPATGVVQALAPGSDALLDLRRWLARRFNWHPA